MVNICVSTPMDYKAASSGEDLGVAFAALNNAKVTVYYYIGTSSLPLSLLLALVFAAGGIIGLLVGIALLVKAKARAYRLQQRLKLVEKEVENLRAIPIQDKH